MKRNSLILIIVCLFLLTLTCFSFWWIALAILVALVSVASKFYLNKIDVINARKGEVEMELIEKCEQLEKAARLEKEMRKKVEWIQKSKTLVLKQINHEIRTP